MKGGFTSTCLGLTIYFGLFSTFVGGLFGDLLADVDFRGIDFVLPGLFIAVFLEMLPMRRIIRLEPLA